MKPITNRIVNLKHRVTFQSPPVDAQGNPAVTNNGYPVTDQWTDYATCWAQVIGGTATRVYGKEYEGSAAIQSQEILQVTIRYRPDIEAKMHFYVDGDTSKVYVIEVVSDKDGMGIWLDLEAIGWDDGGL